MIEWMKNTTKNNLKEIKVIASEWLVVVSLFGSSHSEGIHECVQEIFNEMV